MSRRARPKQKVESTISFKILDRLEDLEGCPFEVIEITGGGTTHVVNTMALWSLGVPQDDIAAIDERRKDEGTIVLGHVAGLGSISCFVVAFALDLSLAVLSENSVIDDSGAITDAALGDMMQLNEYPFGVPFSSIETVLLRRKTAEIFKEQRARFNCVAEGCGLPNRMPTDAASCTDWSENAKLILAYVKEFYGFGSTPWLAGACIFAEMEKNETELAYFAAQLMMGFLTGSDTERGRLLRAAASLGGKVKAARMRPETEAMLNEMERVVGEGHSRANAARIAHKNGFGTSESANRVAWYRSGRGKKV